MRFPFATVVLAVFVVSVYFWSSEGSLYPSSNPVNAFAFGLPNLGGVLFHLFFHVGLLHLLGNIVPLLLFAFLLEQVLFREDVFLVFLSSGLLAGFIFSLLNPSILLVGASAGVSGLMAAAAVSSPKKGILLLLATPLVVSLLVLPAATAFSQNTVTVLVNQTQALNERAQVLDSQNKTVEAEEVKTQASELQQKTALIEEGQTRERETPTDFFVHAIGAIVGFCFVAVFRRKAFHAGLNELHALNLYTSRLLKNKQNGLPRLKKRKSAVKTRK